jgi:carbon monoxide dehydrogenase subunit G
MTKIESHIVSVNKPSHVIFDFLSDLNNVEKLMPQDRISKWESSADTCSFYINGMANIGMIVNERVPYTAIKINSHGKNPFSFTLDIHIKELNNQSEAQLIFNGDMNMMFQMMATKPLTNFFNMLADNLVKVMA